MKNILRRGLALLIIAMIIVSALSISSFAAVSQPAANTGIRDQVCTTFNGTTAPAYYTGSYTYEKLSALSSSSLKSTLATLMTSTHDGISTYDNCRDYAPYTDCEGGDSSHFTMLYTSYSATYSQYNSGQGWNREHVWPQSLGGGNTSGGGADLHHIRPDEARTNSTRSNRLYGNVSNGTAATGNLSGEIGGYYGGDNLYEPLDNVKGDVARICLYVHVRWGSSWGASNITSVFESVDTLLEWCALDPVDTWEMERNDVVEAVQGNRNVFIDYPEFAWMIFGESVPTDLVSPSDGVENGTVSGGGSTGGNQGGTTDPETPVDPEEPTDPETPVDPETTEVTFEFGENGEASHSDGSGATSYTETNGNYTLTFDSCSGVYKNARDAAGNSALKLGTGSVTASFSFTVPDDVKSVILKIAGYKETAAHITVNGESYTITTMSNSGEYTEITVDTSTEKTVSFATVSTGKRAMLNSITYVIESSTGGGGTTEPDTPVTPEPEEPVEPQPNPGEDIGDGSESGGTVVAGSVTITFDDTSKRTSISTTEQVWEENGIVFTNTKTSSSSNIADYSNPVRIYKSSQVIIESPNMTKLVINCDSSYVEGTASGLENAGYTVSTDGSVVTVVLDSPADSVTYVAAAQTRINSIEVFYEGTEAGCTHDKNENGYCKTCDAGFRTASLVLSTDLAMRYGVEIVNAELLSLGSPKMIYTFDGKTYEVVEYVITDGYYVFVFEGIAPDEMTMEIVADFYIGDELIVTFSGYSVEKNLLSIRAKNSTDETLVQLVNDVLVYGRAAQEFTGKNSSDITGADASDVNASAATPSDETLIEGNENSSLYIKSVGVHFDCVNYVYVKIHVSDPAVFGSLTVDDKSYTLSDMVSLGSGNYRLNLDPVQPTSFSELMLITLTGADSVDYTTVIYSIDCYAGYMCGGGAEVGSAMYNLALALYRYGKSAVAYSVAHSA